MAQLEGTSISRGSTKVKLNDTFTYLLWAIELGIVGFLTASIPFGAASEPFNEDGKIGIRKSNGLVVRWKM